MGRERGREEGQGRTGQKAGKGPKPGLAGIATWKGFRCLLGAQGAVRAAVDDIAVFMQIRVAELRQM